jgi:hypothetical protein
VLVGAGIAAGLLARARPQLEPPARVERATMGDPAGNFSPG